ncbi:phage holin family protein [Halomonas sp. McH1-25]|nr:phage holin family protein [Halomonas sp. McH1-25]MCP1363682.1 phage holin family protein [Halomonas sp. BBD48]
MPEKDPNNWQWLLDTIAVYMPHAFAAFLTFAMALTRGMQTGGPFKKAFMGAVVCTLFAIALYPTFQWIAETRGWPPVVGFAPCVFLSFMGTDWIRIKADDIYEVFVGRWRK